MSISNKNIQDHSSKDMLVDPTFIAMNKELQELVKTPVMPQSRPEQLDRVQRSWGRKSKTKRTQNQPSGEKELIDEPANTDVLLGRITKENKNHPGNSKYRKLLSDNKKEYDSAEKWKRIIIKKKIVDEILRDGRFLMKSNEKWEVLDKKTSSVKVRDAIRQLKKKQQHDNDDDDVDTDEESNNEDITESKIVSINDRKKQPTRTRKQPENNQYDNELFAAQPVDSEDEQRQFEKALEDSAILETQVNYKEKVSSVTKPLAQMKNALDWVRDNVTTNKATATKAPAITFADTATVSKTAAVTMTTKPATVAKASVMDTTKPTDLDLDVLFAKYDSLFHEIITKYGKDVNFGEYENMYSNLKAEFQKEQQETKQRHKEALAGQRSDMQRYINDQIQQESIKNTIPFNSVLEQLGNLEHKLTTAGAPMTSLPPAGPKTTGEDSDEFQHKMSSMEISQPDDHSEQQQQINWARVPSAPIVHQEEPTVSVPIVPPPAPVPRPPIVPAPDVRQRAPLQDPAAGQEDSDSDSSYPSIGFYSPESNPPADSVRDAYYYKNLINKK